MPRCRRHPVWIVPAVLIVLGAAGAAQAGTSPSLFLVDSAFSDLQSRIYQADPSTGVLTVRAELGTAYTPVLGMAAASGSVLYLTGTDAGASGLCAGDVACLLIRVLLDPLSTTPARVDVIGPVTENGSLLAGITGMTFRRDGRLYAVSQDTDSLYVLDPATGEATRLTGVDVTLHGGDITFDGSDRLWLWTNIGAGDGLYQVDPVTGHATLFESRPNLDMAGLAAAGHSNTLFGASQTTDTLYEIDAVTGFTGSEEPLFLDGSPFDLSRGDLDSPFCEDDAACDDGDLCTLDTCSPGGCLHRAEEGCCRADADCGGTTLCAVNRCVDNRCVSVPLSVDDGDACTLDGCDTATGPFHHPRVEDADADGVPDCRDRCPGTRHGLLVDPAGCSLSQACPCDGPGRPWVNHGEYVRCVAAFAGQAFPRGARGGKEGSRILPEASQSSCGKPHPRK